MTIAKVFVVGGKSVTCSESCLGITGQGRIRIWKASADQFHLESPVWVIANAAARHDPVGLRDPVLFTELSIPSSRIWDRVTFAEWQQSITFRWSCNHVEGSIFTKYCPVQNQLLPLERARSTPTASRIAVIAGESPDLQRYMTSPCLTFFRFVTSSLPRTPATHESSDH